MVDREHIYVVGAPAWEREGTSLGRSWDAPSRIVAFTTVEAAVFAEATGEVLVPGYFAGGQSPGPMSSLSVDEIIEALAGVGLDDHVRVTTWQGDLALWPEHTCAWVEQLDSVQAGVLRRVFDRHADRAIVNRRSIYRVDAEAIAAQSIAYMVVERGLDEDDDDFTGDEWALRVFGSREPAGALARELAVAEAASNIFEVIETEVRRNEPC